MKIFQIINIIITVLFMLCYAYQAVYLFIALFVKKKKTPSAPMKNRYAVLICARNEERVISDLINSIKKQTYPTELVDVFVLADNCTDRTADNAEYCGAHVYKREDCNHIGKGYALCELRKHINVDYPDGFDGYFVFDADNILDEKFIEEMNNEFEAGNEVVTGFRNTKNFGDNWVSAAYGLLFLRESELLNYPREVLGLSCFVSGTGYCFSRNVAEEIVDWPFYLLTEDAQFSIDSIENKRKIHYCRNAIFYDEQPTKFSQAWIQRLRWCKGYWQVFKQYGKDLLSGIFHGNFACYDMTMAIMPAFILTSASVVSNIGLIVSAIIRKVPLSIALFSIGSFVFSLYFTAFIIGTVLTLYEWDYISMSSFKKLLYLFSFPIFMLSFCPIAIQSLFVKPEWKCIEHTRTVGDIEKQ